MTDGIHHMYARKCEAVEYVTNKGYLKGVGPDDPHPTGGLWPGFFVPLYFYNPKRKKTKRGEYEFFAVKKTGVKWEVVENLTKKLHAK